MKRALLFAALTTAAFGEIEHPTGTRITPPTINAVSPRGIARGTTNLPSRRKASNHCAYAYASYQVTSTG